MIKTKKKQKQNEINEKLENYRGRDEKKYWSYLKNLTGLNKEREKLPEEVKIGERRERGEKRKEVWNEAFSKLGKFNLEDKNFDKRAYLKTKEQVEKWEKKAEERAKIELDKEIEMNELELAFEESSKW
jgi:hypothetical protein